MAYQNVGAFGGVLSPSDRQLLENILNREAQANPEAFLAIYDSVGGQYGYNAGGDSGGLIDIGNGLIDALTGALSGQARTIVNNITENSTKTTTRTDTTTENTTGSQESNTGVHQTVFVEIPTPEEFLDNWQNGFSTWIEGQLQSGQIDKNTYDYFTNNPGELLTPYLAELGRRAAAGEQIFKVVGLEGAAEKLGERFGGGRIEETGTVTETNKITDQELNDLINETVSRLTSSLSDGTPQDVTDTITSVVNQVFRQHQTTTTRSQFQDIARTLQVDEIFGRPQLSTVAKLSPLDYLGGYSKSTILNLAAQNAGRPSPQQVRQEVLPSAARRLG